MKLEPKKHDLYEQNSQKAQAKKRDVNSAKDKQGEQVMMSISLLCASSFFGRLLHSKICARANKRKQIQIVNKTELKAESARA